MNDFTEDPVSFGPFDLFPRSRVLNKSGMPVTLGSRALDILIVLVENAGEVVNHRELISRAWRDLVVESSNLRVQITYLRRSLGDGEQGERYIANVPGQGYTFVAPVRCGRHIHVRETAGSFKTSARVPLRIMSG
jgi:DNA-binding winged helix-turn-helix (wHTH) protein